MYASFKYFIIPGAIVILVPLLVGVFLGHIAVLGFIIGVIITGTQFSISCFNSASAWSTTHNKINKDGISLIGIERLEEIVNKIQKEIKILKESEEREESKENDSQYEILQNDKNYYNELISQMKSLKEQNNGSIPSKDYLNTIIENTNSEQYKEELNKRNLIYEFYKIDTFKSNHDLIYRKAIKVSSIGNDIGDTFKLVAAPPVGVLIKITCVMAVCFSLLLVQSGILYSDY